MCLNAENGALCSLSLTRLSLSLLCVSLAVADASWNSIAAAALLAPAFLCPNQPRRCWPQQGRSRLLSAARPRDAVVLDDVYATMAGSRQSARSRALLLPLLPVKLWPGAVHGLPQPHSSPRPCSSPPASSLPAETASSRTCSAANPRQGLCATIRRKGGSYLHCIDSYE